ncbi:hypothetical protein S245_070973 [Arachis hypogaea]
MPHDLTHSLLLPHSLTSVQPPPCYRRRRNFWKRPSPLPWSPPPIELRSHYPAAPRASIAQPLSRRASCLHRAATVPPRQLCSTALQSFSGVSSVPSRSPTLEAHLDSPPPHARRRRRASRRRRRASRRILCLVCLRLISLLR